jgi:Flp pilus assembly protein TadB
MRLDRLAQPLASPVHSRRTATVLISIGVGVALFGVAVMVIVQEREVIVVAATGLIPFCIGMGFLAAYNLQREEVNKFQMALDDEKTLR